MTENDAIIQIKKTKKSISGKSSQKMKWSDEMLTEERLQGIERIVKEKGSASIPELMERMGISESTARRDLTLLDKQGRLQKVRGGAMIIGDVYSTKEDTVLQKKDRNLEEKVEIAKYAASLIEPNDFVYLDAGTTTELMIDYLTEKDITNCLNALDEYVSEKKLEYRDADTAFWVLAQKERRTERTKAEFDRYAQQQEERMKELQDIVSEIYSHWDEY